MAGRSKSLDYLAKLQENTGHPEEALKTRRALEKLNERKILLSKMVRQQDEKQILKSEKAMARYFRNVLLAGEVYATKMTQAK